MPGMVGFKSTHYRGATSTEKTNVTSQETNF